MNTHPSQEAVVEDVMARFDNLLIVLGEQDDKKVAGINKRIWLKETLTEVLSTYAQTIRDEERERIHNDLDAIWRKYTINTYESSGYRDRADTVIEKFAAGLKEQIDYFTPTTNHTGETDHREDKCRCGKRVAHPYSNVVCSNFPNCSDDKTNP